MDTFSCNLNDVWSSQDGKSWVQLRSPRIWDPRHAMVSCPPDLHTKHPRFLFVWRIQPAPQDSLAHARGSAARLQVGIENGRPLSATAEEFLSCALRERHSPCLAWRQASFVLGDSLWVAAGNNWNLTTHRLPGTVNELWRVNLSTAKY